MEKNDIGNKITEITNRALSFINSSLLKMKFDFSPLITSLELLKEKHPHYSVRLETMKTQLQEIAHSTEDEKTNNPPNLFEGIDDLHVLEDIINCIKTFICNVNVENL